MKEMKVWEFRFLALLQGANIVTGVSLMLNTQYYFAIVAFLVSLSIAVSTYSWERCKNDPLGGLNALAKDLAYVEEVTIIHPVIKYIVDDLTAMTPKERKLVYRLVRAIIRIDKKEVQLVCDEYLSNNNVKKKRR